MNTLLERFDAFQRRRRAVGTPVAVFKRFGEHGGGRLATTISYWSFFSIFPLLLAFVTVLNIVLEDRPGTRQDLVDGALGQVPVIGTQLSDADASLGGSPVAIVLGLAAAIWTGLAAAKALQVALDEIWDVPGYQRPNGAVQALKALAFLVVLAVGVSASTVAGNLASILDVPGIVNVVGLALSFAVNSAVVLFAFRFLTTASPQWPQLRPGVIAAGLGLTALQTVGTTVMNRYIKGADDTYGTFAIVIALLSWFFLMSRITLLGAELNAVLARNLHPRSFVVGSSMTEGDRLATEFDVHRVQHDRRLDSSPLASMPDVT